MGFRSEFNASELWWTVPFAFALGIFAGWGLFSEPNQTPLFDLSAIVWGTAGEWVGGIGALSAALVALAFGVRDMFDRRSLRDAQARKLATQMFPEVDRAIKAVIHLCAFLDDSRPDHEQTREYFPEGSLPVLNMLIQAATFPEMSAEQSNLSQLPANAGQNLLLARSRMQTLRTFLDGHVRENDPEQALPLHIVQDAAKDTLTILGNCHRALMEIAQLDSNPASFAREQGVH